jgi:hypothetical protein
MTAVPGSACLPACWHPWSDAPLGRVWVLNVSWDHAQPALALTGACSQQQQQQPQDILGPASTAGRAAVKQQP